METQCVKAMNDGIQFNVDGAWFNVTCFSGFAKSLQTVAVAGIVSVALVLGFSNL